MPSPRHPARGTAASRGTLRALLLCLVGLALGIAAAVPGLPRSARAALSPGEGGVPPYSSPEFDALVADSYRLFPDTALPPFALFLDRALEGTGLNYRDHRAAPLIDLLDGERLRLAALSDPAERARSERDLAAFLHGAVKRAIPRFSLDRGFEFANVVRTGERQCFLQSVLLSACLRRAGIDAGALMVWANGRGQVSNLGHAVAFARLADGRILLVDASDPVPFMPHRGLYGCGEGGKRLFLRAVYAGDDPSPSRLLAAGDGRALPPDRLRGLPLSFLRSQFDYYRGERAPGGLVAPSGARTPAGLDASIRFLLRSCEEDPDNPLARYALGRAERMAGREAEAGRDIARAADLYRSAGYLPQGVQEALAGR